MQWLLLALENMRFLAGSPNGARGDVQQYIKKIRAAVTQEERENIVFKELAKIRQKYSSSKKCSGVAAARPRGSELALAVLLRFVYCNCIHFRIANQACRQLFFTLSMG